MRVDEPLDRLADDLLHDRDGDCLGLDGRAGKRFGAAVRRLGRATRQIQGADLVRVDRKASEVDLGLGRMLPKLGLDLLGNDLPARVPVTDVQDVSRSSGGGMRQSSGARVEKSDAAKAL